MRAVLIMVLKQDTAVVPDAPRFERSKFLLGVQLEALLESLDFEFREVKELCE